MHGRAVSGAPRTRGFVPARCQHAGPSIQQAASLQLLTLSPDPAKASCPDSSATCHSHAIRPASSYAVYLLRVCTRYRVSCIPKSECAATRLHVYPSFSFHRTSSRVTVIPHCGGRTRPVRSPRRLPLETACQMSRVMSVDLHANVRCHPLILQ